eukprot:CAMPEP_0178900492 /NCGR_PEP_ID=MMETSP0786-20121207/3503_1 /TAXON_ID=186022 /ORGANISM="Thalassionema frauenfeldii, Strain CCMP 1798" /LENGTH=787 /DNA_ID=CAMNT_0020571501 /DNA_START=126 /DNA_END=2490 /DNA_ORIENTATION=+
MLQGSDISVFLAGKWCVANPSHYGDDYYPLIQKDRQTLRGWQNVLGSYEAVQTIWECQIHENKDKTATIPVVTSLKNFDSKLAVVFELEWPEGAWNTSSSAKDGNDVSMTNFPTFLWKNNTNDEEGIPQFLSALSWEGSFLQSVHEHSKGPAGGPTVLYNASSTRLDNVMILSPWNSRYFKTYTAGNHFNYRGQAAISPGTSGRITSLPNGFRQSFLLLQAKHGGLTAGLAEWGQTMKLSRPSQGKKIDDVTLQRVGYQTDNGAMYCFCQETNCSETLLSKMNELEDDSSPMGYLSFQGAGASSGRGEGAPWCISTWGVDGGLNRKEYPLDMNAFQRALGIPLQLYAPYFCPENSYFGNDNSKWKYVTSDETLPGCNGFAFQSVSADQSRDFYGWFMDKGLKVGMSSFETDFMNQNYNCVPNFVQSPKNGDQWLAGDAALERNITIQWCYATPSDLLASLDMPAVTNFRVSFDFCYGASWDIGESSLLVWALGAAPSKDTLWTTENNRAEIPGCTWTEDHENLAAELHLVLALMSTGPVGISDAIGMTNETLLQRAITPDGILLKPSKPPITAVDSTFVETSAGGRLGKDGYLYGTAGIEKSWIFVSFKMKDSYGVKLIDFWPRVGTVPALLAYRTYDDGVSCLNGTDAVSSGCVRLASITHDTQHKEIFVAPKSKDSFPGSLFVPTITSVWKQSCSGWFFLGELKKYVSLSPVRFRKLSCLPSGLSIVITGTVGETVHVTALKPLNATNLEVIQQNVIIPDSKEVTLVLGGQNFEIFSSKHKSWID